MFSEKQSKIEKCSKCIVKSVFGRASFANTDIQRLETLYSMIANCVDGMIITDVYGVIEVFNPVCEKIFGFSQKDVLGQNIVSLFNGENEQIYYNLLGEYRANNDSDIITSVKEIVGKRQDGTEFPIEVALSEVKVSDEVRVLSYLIRDITKRKDMEEKLRSYTFNAKRQKLEADEVNRQKSNFLATMSHKIRTPMNDIVGMTELLMESGLSDLQKRYSDSIMRSSKILLNIITNISDLSKIEEGKVDLNSVPFNLRMLLENLRDFYYIYSMDKGLDIKMEYPDDIPSCMTGDQTRIRQVMANFMDNAVRFTKEGSIEIKVESLNKAVKVGNILKLKISVKDTGIGIPFDMQNNLLSRFSNINTAIKADRSGTGLGLALNKHIVEAMGGTVNFESIEGKGSNFWFTFDLVISEDDSIVKNASNISDEDLEEIKRLRVLLVEDNLINQELVNEMLKSLGCRVTAVSGGRKAIEIVQSGSKYDIVLMDCHMQDVDGFEATRRIRHLIKNKDIDYVPIIAVTARALEGDKQKCLAAGMDDYMSKPFTRRELYSMLAKWANFEFEGDLDLDITEENLDYQKAAKEGHIDYAALESVKNLVGDKYLELTKKFIDTTDEAILRLAGHVEGDKDLSVIVVNAHTLKSSSAYMGAREVSANAKDLEIKSRLAVEEGQTFSNDMLEEVFEKLDKSWQLIRGFYLEELENYRK